MEKKNAWQGLLSPMNVFHTDGYVGKILEFQQMKGRSNRQILVHSKQKINYRSFFFENENYNGNNYRRILIDFAFKSLRVRVMTIFMQEIAFSLFVISVGNT